LGSRELVAVERPWGYTESWIANSFLKMPREAPRPSGTV